MGVESVIRELWEFHNKHNVRKILVHGDPVRPSRNDTICFDINLLDFNKETKLFGKVIHAYQTYVTTGKKRKKRKLKSTNIEKTIFVCDGQDVKVLDQEYANIFAKVYTEKKEIIEELVEIDFPLYEKKRKKDHKVFDEWFDYNGLTYRASAYFSFTHKRLIRFLFEKYGPSGYRECLFAIDRWRYRKKIYQNLWIYENCRSDDVLLANTFMTML